MNKKKFERYDFLTKLFKYASYALYAAALIAFPVMAISGVALATTLVTAFGLVAFGMASQVTSSQCKVYRDGYEAKLHQTRPVNVVVTDFETEHELKLEDYKQQDCSDVIVYDNNKNSDLNR